MGVDRAMIMRWVPRTENSAETHSASRPIKGCGVVYIPTTPFVAQKP